MVSQEFMTRRKAVMEDRGQRQGATAPWAAWDLGAALAPGVNPVNGPDGEDLALYLRMSTTGPPLTPRIQRAVHWPVVAPGVRLFDDVDKMGPCSLETCVSRSGTSRGPVAGSHVQRRFMHGDPR